MIGFNRVGGLSEESLFEKNEQQVNVLVCRGMACVFLVFPVMLIINAMGIFKFSNAISVMIMIIGSFCTLSPLILQKLVKNHSFIKYYALICIIILVNVLATQYHIGIYITLILAPVVSCLYFDKKFMTKMLGLSYVAFLISYYFRCVETRNILYPTETVWETYIPLAAGYTIEFLVALFFLYKLADRTHNFLVEQKRMLSEMEKEEVKVQLALNATKDILFEYDIQKNYFTSNGTIRGWNRKDIEIEDFSEYVKQMHWKTDAFLKALDKYSKIPEEEGNCFQEEICISFIEDGQEYPIWAYFELNILRDLSGKATTVLGKLRDITQQKMEAIQAEEMKKFDTLSGMYNYASLYKIVKEKGEFQAKTHQIMFVHVKNYGEIAQCYGEIYRDFVMVNIAEVIKSTVQGEGVLPCRLSDTVFLVYVEDVDGIDCNEMRKELNVKLSDLYIGEKGTSRLEYDFGYYSGEEKIEDLIAISLRHVNAGELTDKEKMKLDNEASQTKIAIVSNEQTFCQLSEERRQIESENLIANIAALIAGAKDFNSAVWMALAQIGRFFELDGVRVYKFPDTMKSVLPDFAWAVKDKVEKEYNSIPLTYEVRSFFVQNFGRSRVVDNTIGAFQDFFRQFGENPLLLNKYSSLICPVTMEKECRAVILYDVLETGYSWSDQQKELLLAVGKILGNNILASQMDLTDRAKNIFLSNMSYEIRSPINAIMGMTEIARGQMDNPQQLKSCLDSIDTSSKQLLTIVNDAFDLSKMELGKMKLAKDVFSMEDMLAQIESQIILGAERKNIEFILERRFKENLLFGDVSRIYQVVSYLIENAVRYTKRGGSVHALVEEIAHSDQDVTLFFEIQDNGEGIREERRGKLFAAFEDDDTTQFMKHGDTGLDLAVCYHLVQMMGAELEVKGEPNQGSTFYFTLRLEIPPKERLVQFLSRNRQKRERTIDLSGKTILLAEDNAVSAEIVKRLLEMQGASVWIAENGEECVKQYWQSQINEIAFILMDINMPKMNGHEATRDIRASGRKDALQIPIIAMTANAFEEDMQESLAAGMDAHLTKPIQLKALLAEVAKVLEKKQEAEEN